MAWIWVVNAGVIPATTAFITWYVINKNGNRDEGEVGSAWFIMAVIMFMCTVCFIHSIVSELILIAILIAVVLLPYLCVRLHKRKHTTTNKQCLICNKTFIFKFRIEDKQICDSCMERITNQIN